MSEAEVIDVEAQEAPVKARAVAKRGNGSSGHVVARSQASATPMELLDRALSNGADIALLERLMTLQERWEQGQAKKEFYDAKAAFKMDVPDIIKDMENKQYGSKYASIGNVVNTVNRSLSKHGLDAQWEIEQGDKQITVYCILTHSSGHSERAKMFGPPDTSGQKNPIQQIKSTITYLKLATFEAVTGVATKEGNNDDDGNASGTTLITDEQASAILDLITEVGADTRRFCEHFKIGDVAMLPAAQFKRAVDALKAKGAKK